jgi:hypothetical protein
LDSLIDKQLVLSTTIQKMEQQLEILDFHKQTEEILSRIVAQEQITIGFGQELTQIENSLVQSE